ncbi:hypothetical protein O3M35_007585 [Rhynocoris fuscipes]|uniref:Uncharacterized protein n=1 Tax=Rhynocoris fuscipes TaxID=488301 RepID=A0AAW1DAN0_9HEMI
MWIYQTSLVLLILVHSPLLKIIRYVEGAELNLDPELYGNVTEEDLHSFISSIYKKRLKRESHLKKNPVTCIAEDFSLYNKDCTCHYLKPESHSIIYDNDTDFARDLKFSPNYYNCGMQFDVGKLLLLVRKYSKLKPYTFGNDASNFDALSDENKISKVTAATCKASQSQNTVSTCAVSVNNRLASPGAKYDLLKETKTTSRLFKSSVSFKPFTTQKPSLKQISTSTHNFLYDRMTDYTVFNMTELTIKSFTKIPVHKKQNEIGITSTIRTSRLYQQPKLLKYKKPNFPWKSINEVDLGNGDNIVQSIIQLEKSPLINAPVNYISESEKKNFVK